jgi:hemolysin III
MELLEIISVWGIREPFSTLSHALGALVALGATIALVLHARRQGRTGWAVAVYGVTVVLAFSASALFHYVETSPERLDLYGKIDHVAIFLLIAGTGTAIYSALDAWWASQLLALTWGLTLVAIAVELTVESLGGWQIAVIYLALGWTCSLGLFATARLAPWRRLRSFVAGALAFSVGAVVFATGWPVLWPGVIGGHEVFHGLVLIGEAFHFHFVYRYCTCPAAFCEPDSVLASAPTLLAWGFVDSLYP